MKWVKPSTENEEIVQFLNHPSGTKMINRYPDCQVLAHKEVFALMMKTAQMHQPNKFDFIPPSFELPSKIESARLDYYMQNNPKATFIAKP